MTEAEWLTCTDPTPMLEFLRGKISDRKLRLFAAACCRRIWHLIPDEQCRRSVEVAEAFADGRTAAPALGAAYGDALRVCQAAMRDWGLVGGRTTMQIATKEQALAYDLPALVTAVTKEKFDAVEAQETVNASIGVVMDSAIPAHLWSKGEGESAAWQAADEEHRAQVRLLHDITGSPFQPFSADPGWLPPGVVELARTIYDDRAFDRLPELADVLERAGCDNADILTHCRQSGEHVRGCWVVDLILGKE